MTYFVATTKGTLAKGLARLFRNNVWKLHGLPESVISDRGLQFVVELTKELNKMLEIEMRLSTVFHPQTDCCGNHLSQRQMISQAVNLLSQISNGKFTRELNKESLLN